MTFIDGVINLQGSGKTMLMTILGTMYHEKYGLQIASNYHLKKMDYIPVETIEDVQELRNCLFLGDELWLWLMARSSMSKINQEMMKVIFLNRKRKVSILWSSQLPRQSDVLLYECTQHFYNPNIIEINGKRYVYYICSDQEGNKISEKIIKRPVTYWGQHYDTYQEIKSIKANEKENPRPGTELEKFFIKAVRKLSNIRHVDLIPNSGAYSSMLFDILVWDRKTNFYLVDVKKSYKNGYVDLSKSNLNKKITNAMEHNAQPLIAFPDPDKKLYTNPNAWYVYRLHSRSDILYKVHPKFTTMMKKSITLKNYFLQMKEKTKVDLPPSNIPPIPPMEICENNG